MGKTYRDTERVAVQKRLDRQAAARRREVECGSGDTLSHLRTGGALAAVVDDCAGDAEFALLRSDMESSD